MSSSINYLAESESPTLAALASASAAVREGNRQRPERDRMIRELYQAGHTQAALGRAAGITRHQVWDIINRRHKRGRK